ncbi:MAG TPA: efflux RND transporter permease subunit [Candidatus Omnitrophota bacterium]|nr:efflux RND transporter permease subunit [Candidatus Omnitrophota bacterium]
MKLAEFSVKNSLLVNLLSIFIIVVGFFTMFRLKREAFPPIQFDEVTVTTVYPGAPAEDVEKFVTTPIEKELRGISGVKEMSSSSEEGLSKIGIEIDPNVSNKRKVVDDIKDAVDRVRDLPQEVKDDPLVVELSADEFPVLQITLSGDFSEHVKRQYAEHLEDLILDIKGVGSVRRVAWRDPEFWVEVDPSKLSEYHVSLEEVMAALGKRNVTIPAGQLDTRQTEFNVRITGEFTQPQEVEEVIIRANDAGNWLRVRDIGRVVSTFEDPDEISKLNGKKAVSMIVVKNDSGDIIAIVAEIQKTIEEFKKTLPQGMDIEVTDDMSYYVKRRLGVLKNNGIIGLVLVIVVLFLFLDPIPALMTALGVPVALFSTFIVMQWMGLSINLVTMLGLIIVLGMLVDDGIVVSENVYRYIEEGMSPKEAAVRGTTEVIAPVTGTILTTCAAFAPLMFMPDIMGKFVRYIPVVVIIALFASLLEAFIILPSHLSDFIRTKKFKDTHKDDVHKDRKWYKWLVEAYAGTLNKALDHRYFVFIGLIGLLFFSLFIAATHMKMVLFTGEGIEEFQVRAEAVKGTPLTAMDERIRPVEALIETLPDSELDSYVTDLGLIAEDRGFDPHSKKGTHLAQITVFLTPAQSRKRTPQEIVASLRPELEKIQGFDKLYFHTSKEGPPVGKPIEIGIKGDDFFTLEQIAQKFINALKGIDGVSDVLLGHEVGKKQLKVNIDEAKAQKYYLTVGQIAESVRNALDGGVATTIKPVKAEEEITVRVRFPEESRRSMDAFSKILVPNSKGNLVPLSAVAQVDEYDGVFKINHLDGKRVVYVTAQVDEKKATSYGVNNQLQKEFKEIPAQYPGYTVKYSGEYEEQQVTKGNLQGSFLVAMFLIFIILAAVFNSIVQPFVVMMAIPFGIIGVILAFLAHGRPLSFFALMGVVGLTGIVVNDSIVLMDFVNKLRQSGHSRRASLIDAGRMRLRPVLMTTITTLAGLVSVAYGIGGGDPFLKPMALAIFWGLLFATGLTLIAIPCIYAIIDDIWMKFFHRGTVKVSQDAPEI